MSGPVSDRTDVGQAISRAAIELPELDRKYFCDERPKVVEPYKGIIEKFLNWARANSL